MRGRTGNVAAAALAQAVVLGGAAPLHAALPDRARQLALAQSKIQHIIIIMQENRSFDSYFGTFPGANGYPANLCVPIDPTMPKNGCVKPFHDPHEYNGGGPHGTDAAQADLNDGIQTALMNGFVAMEHSDPKQSCFPADNPTCVALYQGASRNDVMGYHTDAEIPNYWAYAKHFVLQEQLEEGVRSYSFDSHVDMTSEWVAACTNPQDAMSCVSTPSLTPVTRSIGEIEFPWVNLFQLLDAHGVSWKYYVGEGTEPDCPDGAMNCVPGKQIATHGSIWNPAPFFNYVQAQGSPYLLARNPYSTQFVADINAGALPQVSWIIPTADVSEHPPAGVTDGMEYVTGIVNRVMSSPYWANTAIFISWDDWGGFYDHVIPGIVDSNTSKTPVQGFGLRVPGLMISAYARPGMIDGALLSFDSYATFMEDLFTGGARLVPSELGNPDPRPTIRDELTSATLPSGAQVPIGDILNEFDFTQTPLPPMLLTTAIPSRFIAACGATIAGKFVCKDKTVSLSWSTPAADAGGKPFTYHVLRDGTALTACAGTATKCSDIPGSGNHLYDIYSVDKNGVVSPTSAAVEADEP